MAVVALEAPDSELIRSALERHRAVEAAAVRERHRAERIVMILQRHTDHRARKSDNEKPSHPH